MRNSTKMGGSIKKKYQAGGSKLDSKAVMDAFKKGAIKNPNMKMNPAKIQVGTTKPMTPAQKKAAMDKFMQMSPKKQMGGPMKPPTGAPFKTKAQKAAQQAQTIPMPSSKAKTKAESYMDRATKAKMNSPKTKALEAEMAKKLKATPKKEKGGVVAVSPIQGRTGRRGAAGSNMAKGGQKFPDLTGDGRVTKKDILKGRGVLKKGGAKKYQDGGVMGQVKGITKAIANNAKGYDSEKAIDNRIDQIKTDRLKRMGTTTGLGTDAGPKIDYLGRGKGSTDYYDEKYYGMSVPEAARLAVKEGEQKKKFTRAAHPSDVLGQKPKYLKKAGGQAHPGFKAVQAKIAAKSGVSKKAAGAILAASTRKASAKAKAANPRLKRVKG